MLVSRSSREKPRPLERFWRTSSPSRTSTGMPRPRSSALTAAASVDLPAPDSPVNHNVNPCVCAIRLSATSSGRVIALSPDRRLVIPPLHTVERGTGGEAETKRARFPREAGPICVARAVYNLVEHHPMPATTAPQPRPLPEGQGHIIRQGGQQLVVVWRAIMILLFTRRVRPCQPYFRVVDKDWARRLVTSHAAYPFAPPAPPSPPVAWGEPEAYAKQQVERRALSPSPTPTPRGRRRAFRDA